MTYSRFTTLFLAAAVLVMSSNAQAQDPHAKAKALREAARLEAQADFWFEVAVIVGDSTSTMREDFIDAWVERKEALDLADRQYEARVQYESMLDPQLYQTKIVASQFSAVIDNTYMPFVPGRTMVYERQMAQGIEHIEITALQGTVIVNGIECRPVREHETIDGVLVEDTENWLSQHISGDVWYFGEITREYEQGFLQSLDGSWRYGSDNAEPGYLMLNENHVGDFYRQEYAMGVAEDLGQVLATDVTVTVPVGTFHNCLKVLEVTPIDPDDVVTKYYAPDVGMVLEIDLNTGERLELIEVRN